MLGRLSPECDGGRVNASGGDGGDHGGTAADIVCCHVADADQCLGHVADHRLAFSGDVGSVSGPLLCLPAAPAFAVREVGDEIAEAIALNRHMAAQKDSSLFSVAGKNGIDDFAVFLE